MATLFSPNEDTIMRIDMNRLRDNGFEVQVDTKRDIIHIRPMEGNTQLYDETVHRLKDVMSDNRAHLIADEFVHAVHCEQIVSLCR